ncbi:ABC transporter permease [Aquimarina brevivitae]|uniref:ABC-2 type transport system permease protein n=1 Tax=Aquimarina brevivitae TaxID=323412 RepID=A0A4Q7PIF8_9FLAO|nr:ABC transporter permease [Aquimarina brevivitae]RZT00226.1 ABC-2 type transport system permease protein [Aquimarina brevivitae]
MNNLPLILKREFIARVRNRTFVVMTFLSPLIFVGMILLISWLATINSSDVKQVAVVDETGSFFEILKSSEEVNFLNYTDYKLEQAKDSVRSKELYGLLYIPGNTANSKLEESVQFYADESPNISVIRNIEKSIATKITNQNFKEQGLDIHKIEEARARVNIQIENFSGEKTSKMSTYIKMIFGGAAGYFLMMFIIIYGNMVMRSVIEEKSNRIIEIIISSVKPMQLMLGKILGTSFAGILQFFIWVLLGGILLTVITSIFGVNAQPPSMDAAEAMAGANQEQIQLILNDILKLPLLTLVVSFLIYFIGGYFLYSAIYAAIGAAVDSETDSQQFMLPVILPLMLGIYVGFFSVIENPHGTISTIFSMIPLTSPIVMLMRIPFGVPWWEVAISMLLLIASIVLVIWFAGKIYRIGILMYGKKPTYKELFKWLKY